MGKDWIRLPSWGATARERWWVGVFFLQYAGKYAHDWDSHLCSSVDLYTECRYSE